MKLKSQIEAILFLSDKPIKAAAMARIVSQDVQVVRQALLELIHDYEERDGGLEITDDDGYIIQVRDEYASIVDEFAPMEMPVALIRTLSAIAIKQPVPQSEIIKIRGAGAYDHIKELILRDLISKKEEGGRSPMLGTTKKFQEYFRLTQDAKMLRTQLVDEKKAASAENVIGVEGDDGANFAPLDSEHVLTATAMPGHDSDQTAQRQQAVLAEVADVMKTMAGSEAIETIETRELLETNSTIGATETHEIVNEEKEVETISVSETHQHLETKTVLEKVFATSPDASFVFRAPAESKVANAKHDLREISDDDKAEASGN
jgi:segregation and condensation protein B